MQKSVWASMEVLVTELGVKKGKEFWIFVQL